MKKSLFKKKKKETSRPFELQVNFKGDSGKRKKSLLFGEFHQRGKPEVI